MHVPTSSHIPVFSLVETLRYPDIGVRVRVVYLYT